jgi:hypothetical protein
MNTNLKLARQFAWATAITTLLAAVAGLVGVAIGVETHPSHRLQVIPPPFQPMALFLALSCLLLIVTVCVRVAEVAESL